MADYIPVDRLKRRLAEIEDKVRDLQTEQAVLQQLIKQAIDLDMQPRLNGDRHILKLDRDPIMNSAPELPTTDAVENLVKSLPGLTRSEVADRLKDKIKSSAKNKRRLVYNTALNLTKSGVLIENNGKLYAANQISEDGSMFPEELE